ncbi:MAG: anhydro-N-acetylmuramic acid kinase [Planctomycetota bacterium]
MPERRRLVAGCMTGTSLDGLDVALVEIVGSGLDMTATLVATASRDLGDCGPRLRDLATNVPMTAGDIARVCRDFGRLHADVLRGLAGDRRLDLVAIHGQTVFHRPPVSWQLIDPWPVVQALNCPVVTDLRGADLVADGEGAPITPLADWVLFRDATRSRAIVNLGGFCNVTLLPAGDDIAGIRGFDVCVCNQLLDAAARRALGEPFDRDGGAAALGEVDDTASSELQQLLLAQRAQDRSLGTDDESLSWLDAHVDDLAPNDLLATTTHAIGRTIRDVLETKPHAERSVASDPESSRSDVRPGPTLRSGLGFDRSEVEVVIAGGGARNAALVGAMGPTKTTDTFGVPIEAREAVAMAILGALAHDRVPITLPAVTRRQEVVPLPGSWTYPT